MDSYSISQLAINNPVCPLGPCLKAGSSLGICTLALGNLLRQEI